MAQNPAPIITPGTHTSHVGVKFPMADHPEFIDELPVDGYTLMNPIPVILEQVDDGIWIARFEEANLGMSGSTPEDAKHALAYEILDTLEFFLEKEDKLIPKLKGHLGVLRKYIEVV